MALFVPSDALEALNRFVRNRRFLTLSEEKIEIARAKLLHASNNNDWGHIFYIHEEDIRDNRPDYKVKKTSIEDYRIEYWDFNERLIIETPERFGVMF